MLHIQPTPMQITRERPPKGVRITRQLGLLLQPVQHDLDTTPVKTPDIAHTIAISNDLLQHICSSLGERRLSLLASLAPYHDCVALPIDMCGFDVEELIQPYPTIRKQTDDALVPNVVRLFNEILYLLTVQAGQYYPGHLRRINLGDGVVLDIALPVQPVAESPNGAVVGILTVLACKLGQVEINVSVGERAAPDKWCQSGLVEFNSAW